ncbi:M20 family peptidase [Haloplanus rallus]|jgi:succinyl-diaminopimelate desuccinylase|uniref:M20 family peptidase n=1 Tax=Haloplanus rallus TaxID=1816183 RepID=A0A6B9F7E8_9EURY|nr:M20 family metallopeptidase [Haloplanus rallus]QGX94241.1 M20 family peptidase [Haloplanus rallus]
MSTHSDRLERIVSELVARESENPPGNEAAVAEFVHEWFADRGIDADLVTRPDPDRPQVAARVGDGEPTVVLNGHIDVVPAGDRSKWTHDPYGAAVVDGTLYGRGSADMKTGVALGMLATADFASAFDGGKVDGSVVFHAAMGEETAEPGTKTLLESGYDGDYGVVLEPTGMRTATSEKGLAWYEITVAGDPSHASRPDQGDNAIANARPVLDALDAYDTRVRERRHDLLGPAYATTTCLETGVKENVVPGSATITVDRRLLPSEDVTDIDAEVDALLDDVESEHGVRTDWERTRTYEPAEIPVDNPLASVFREQSAEIAGVPDDPWGIEASTDVRNFVNDAGTPAITWGPGDLDQAHTVDECIDLAHATTALDVLEASLTELFEADG